LAAGFIEPLESTSIALIQTAIERIKSLVTKIEVNESVVKEFNESSIQEYERVRDFIIMHYYLNGREDSQFWQDCRDMSLPETLSDKLAFYAATGNITNKRWEIFHVPSWIAVMFGLKHFPKAYDPRADVTMTQDELTSAMFKMKTAIQQVVVDTYDHREFLSLNGMNTKIYKEVV